MANALQVRLDEVENVVLALVKTALKLTHSKLAIEEGLLEERRPCKDIHAWNNRHRGSERRQSLQPPPCGRPGQEAYEVRRRPKSGITSLVNESCLCKAT